MSEWSSFIESGPGKTGLDHSLLIDTDNIYLYIIVIGEKCWCKCISTVLSIAANIGHSKSKNTSSLYVPRQAVYLGPDSSAFAHGE